MKILAFCYVTFLLLTSQASGQASNKDYKSRIGEINKNINKVFYEAGTEL